MPTRFPELTHLSYIHSRSCAALGGTSRGCAWIDAARNTIMATRSGVIGLTRKSSATALENASGQHYFGTLATLNIKKAPPSEPSAAAVIIYLSDRFIGLDWLH